MQFPYRSEDAEAALEHLPLTPYATSDRPSHLSSIERSDIENKQMVDKQGTAANAWWHEENRRANREEIL